MPVVVTGADEPAGRAVLEALRADGARDLRALVSSRAAQRELVPLGVRTALVALDDAEVLAAALTGAHTVVHAAGGEPADTWAQVAQACATAGVTRLVTVTARAVPGAVPPGPDAVAQVLAADARP